MDFLLFYPVFYNLKFIHVATMCLRKIQKAFDILDFISFTQKTQLLVKLFVPTFGSDKMVRIFNAGVFFIVVVVSYY